MRTDRLLKLADALEKDAKNKRGIKFDLGTWACNAAHKDIKEHDLVISYPGFDKKTDVKLDCGTAACAIGYAAISGIFKRQGFGFKLNNDSTIVPTYDGSDGWYAVCDFFDIDVEVADHLFDSSSYTHTKGQKAELAVAKRIREVVSARE